MPTASGPSTGSGQASMNIATMLIISQHISQNPNDEQDVTSALQMLSRLPDERSSIKKASDSGLFKN